MAASPLARGTGIPKSRGTGGQEPIVTSGSFFAPLLLLTLNVLSLPSDIAAHWLSRHYAQSIQGWSSWAWDWTKGELLNLAVGAVLVWLLYALIRHSPRRWWFYAWVGALPLIIFSVFIYPLVVEPLYFQFHATRLAPSSQLATQLRASGEAHAGQDVPPSHACT